MRFLLAATLVRKSGARRPVTPIKSIWRPPLPLFWLPHSWGPRNSRAGWHGLALVLALGLGVPCQGLQAGTPLPGLTQPAPAKVDKPAAESADQAEQALVAKLAEAEAAATSGSQETPPDLEPAEIAERRELLTKRVDSYRRQLTQLRALADSRVYLNMARKEGFNIPRVPNSDTYPFVVVDQLREAERSVTQALKALVSTAKLLQREYESSILQLGQRQTQVRQAAERIETHKGVDQLPRLRWRKEQAELWVGIQEGAVGILDTELQANKEKQAYQQARLDEIRVELAKTQGKVVFTRQDLDQVKANLAEERETLTGEMESVANAAEAARKELVQAEAALAKALEGDSQERAALHRTAEVKRLESENLALSGRLLSFRVQGLGSEGEIWEKRWHLRQTQDPETIRVGGQEAEREQAEAAVWLEFIEQRSAEARGLVVEHEGRVKRAGSLEESLHHTRMAELYRQLIDLYEEFRQHLDAYLRLVEFWSKDVEIARGGQTLTHRVESRAAEVWQILLAIWNYEVFTLEDQIEVEGRVITGKRGVTVGKFVHALLILGLGFWLSRWASRRVEQFTIRRLHMEASHARLTRRWIDLVTLVILVVIALNLVKIPLTLFAFLGGAVAIGIGFGTQTLFKNLISGLMILFERPFHLGDLVEVGAVRGRVSDVGLRSSVVRDALGIETLIPNSSFLEQNVTNWTYTHASVRFSVQVGVAYGTDCRRVRDLLVEVGKRHGQVLPDPAPFVLFEDFGADALLFSLNFWLELHPNIDRLVVQSDLRFMIEAAFADAGISIAFPQRDVHLDTARPLAVRLVE